MRSVLGQENVASAAAVTINTNTIVNNSKMIQCVQAQFMVISFIRSSPYNKIKSNVINQIEPNRTEPGGSFKEINRS